jgi:hypothetical protein
MPDEYGATEYGGLPVKCRMLPISLCSNIFQCPDTSDNARLCDMSSVGQPARRQEDAAHHHQPAAATQGNWGGVEMQRRLTGIAGLL